MKRSNRGYSLLVLIIAIIVILIITSGVISTINVTKEDRQINNFIYDINNIEEAVKQYYSSTGMIPTLDTTVDISSIASQLDENDGDTYYRLDISKLDINNLHEKDNTYIINVDSLRVYMQEGIEYRGNTYYTLTDELMGTSTKYDSQNIDIVCTVNPTSWTQRVDIRVTIANVEDTSDWTFAYNIGPKDLKFFQGGGGNEFEYGQTISVNTNGIYSIYIEDGEGQEYIKNIVIKNIDEYYPKYTKENGIITVSDDETGIKEIRYKTYAQYHVNEEQFSEIRSKADYYLLDGTGNTIDSLKTDISNYTSQLAVIQSSRAALERNYSDLTAEEKEENEEYISALTAINSQATDLSTRYAYILSPSTRFVLFVMDYADNAIAIDEEDLTFEMICNSFNLTMP